MQDRNVMNHKQKYIVYVAVDKSQNVKNRNKNKYSKSILNKLWSIY